MLRVVWLPTAVMLESGADDLSRGCYKYLDSTIRISSIGWYHIKKYFPAPYHLVFGHCLDADENDEITYSSFHQENHDQFNGVDGFTHLAKALDPLALVGCQVMLPPKHLIEKTVQLLESIQQLEPFLDYSENKFLVKIFGF